ncbi:TY-Chap2 family putative peptide chaperone [Demequina pelophila]|uniref:TY-Chap2 family putative peptide chaperone n=1 Tax=Demequina pelophila TaxID=1638984 RepID=UPI0007852B72|nr:hypothetical protein [Demequina pelophila]
MSNFGLEDQGAERVRIAASWDFAARIVGIDPASRVYEYHPGGGMYDCLSIGRQGLKIDINRNGSVHVHVSDGGEAMPLVEAEEWRAAASSAPGTAALLERLAAHCRLSATKSPSRAPWPLTYQVIARVLASRIFDSALWDCRLQFDDSSGHYSEPNLRFTAPSPEASSIPPTEFWAIMRDDKPVAYVWNGWAWNGVGERINLAARYSRGDSIDALARDLVSRSGTKASTTLPPVRVQVEPQGYVPPPMANQ